MQTPSFLRGRSAQAVGALLRDVTGDALRASKQHVERALSSGPYRAPLDINRDRVALLFYENYDKDQFVHGDRHVKRRLREVYNALRGAPPLTGFYVAFASLKSALEEVGYDVRVNDFELARRNPTYPIGITGYPHILDGWSLPNPAVLGPGLLDHPGLRPHLMDDPRFKLYICSSEWQRGLFAKVYDDKCVTWFAGIDADEWPDLRAEPKEVDFLFYDKVIWNRDERSASLVEPILGELRRRGFTIEVLRYRRHDHAQYRAALRRARGMVFLVEHETQGIAYQEAMACGVPILAWEQGKWLDPTGLQFGREDIPATSVPYFSPQCGERFKDAASFPAALDRFLENRDMYDPRKFVMENLSRRASAETYLRHYTAAAAS